MDIPTPPTTPCWIWRGRMLPEGYGYFAKTRTAHRFSYQLARPIPDGMTIDHLCRVRACYRPSHLEAVPSRVNVLRGVGITAVNARKLHCPAGHKYDRVRTGGERMCSTCSIAQKRALRLARRENHNAQQRVRYNAHRAADPEGFRAKRTLYTAANRAKINALERSAAARRRRRTVGALEQDAPHAV